MNLFDSYLVSLSTNYDNIVIYGDLNLPKIIWDSPGQTTGSYEIQFTELLHDYFVSQVNHQPTVEVIISWTLLLQACQNK